MTLKNLALIGLFALSACAGPKPSDGVSAAQGPATAFTPATCSVGIYGAGADSFVAITRDTDGFRYSFNDGSIGKVGSEYTGLECGTDSVLVAQGEVWKKIPVRVTDTRFTSGEVTLAGRLLEPIGADATTPLIVYAHGSEAKGWIGSFRDPYQMVGRGISVFVYDKRGTGLSEGVYSQNFPRLADDLVAASGEAKRLAGARFGRFGLVGLSQGGWIAPLAAKRAGADFIAIGYGLVADIREEDAAQVQKELRDAGYDDGVLRIAREITDITARIASSDYTDGLDDLSRIQRRYSSEDWFPIIRGGYSGVFLNMSAEELRERGVPQFNDLDIDWSLDPTEVLRGVDVPQLWVLAGEDREAPIGLTLARLELLREQGSQITIYKFPDTDHGMWEYVQSPDGRREYIRIASGYYDLMADYIADRPASAYGRSRIVQAD